MNQYLHQAIEKDKKDGYLQYHAPRYDRLLTLLHQYHSAEQRILDIGRSPFTDIACDSLNTPIDTLGFEPDRKTNTGFNYQFDLNHAQNSRQWRNDIPKYDIIVFSEVIEHLYTSPKLVLTFLNTLLAKNGIIIIQTPNAVVAHKRIQLLLGYNPYSLISENARSPAHFREYTAAELSAYCHQAGFGIEQMTFENYFDYRYTSHTQASFTTKKINRIITILYHVMPRSLRPGLCYVIRST